MKLKRHLFFDTRLCTGCHLCELSCSQENAGEYNVDGSTIHILSHPDLGSHLVSIRPMPCVCGNGKETCVEICNAKAIRFVDDRDVPLALKDEAWTAAPIFE